MFDGEGRGKSWWRGLDVSLAIRRAAVLLRERGYFAELGDSFFVCFGRDGVGVFNCIILRGITLVLISWFFVL